MRREEERREEEVKMREAKEREQMMNKIMCLKSAKKRRGIGKKCFCQ